MNYKASVIISVYDNPRFLNLVLDSLKLQTEQNFEIIISEDGENKAMKELVEKYNAIYLRGNHEEYFLQFLVAPED